MDNFLLDQEDLPINTTWEQNRKSTQGQLLEELITKPEPGNQILWIANHVMMEDTPKHFWSVHDPGRGSWYIGSTSSCDRSRARDEQIEISLWAWARSAVDASLLLHMVVICMVWHSSSLFNLDINTFTHSTK